MGVGKMIQQALKIREMSQTELAARVSIPLSTLNGYILGKYEPDVEKMKEIAESLDVTLNYLLEIDAVNILSDDELFMVLTYRKFDEVKRKVALEHMRFLRAQG